jgi:chemotaxis methyl-accepting protein methylase
MIEWLEPGGYLFVGHSESLSSKEYELEYVQPAVYRKPAEGRWRTGRRGAADHD